jgi:hypothetical protein
VAGTGAGKGRQIIFPGDRVGEKRPGTSGNGLPGFPVASLSMPQVSKFISNQSLEIKMKFKFVINCTQWIIK